jgi:hypothetical protein
MKSEQLSFSSTIPAIINSYLGRIHTATLGRVDDYHLDVQTVDVTPIVNLVFENGEVLEYKKLTQVPVIFPGGSGGGVTFPIKVGDVGALIFAERSIDESLKKGVRSTPIHPRQFSLSDAIFIPGIVPENQPPSASYADATEVTCGDVRIVLRGGRVAIGVGSVEVLKLIGDTLQALVEATVTVAGVPVPLNNAASFAALKVQLELIRGDL